MKPSVSRAILLFSACLPMTAQQVEWKQAWSLSCAQIKLDGKRLNKVRFTVYKAADEGKEGNDSLPVVYTGRTNTFGHFQVPVEKLQRGEHYYIVFHPKTGDVKVPVKMSNNAKQQCEMRDHVFEAKSDGTVETRNVDNGRVNASQN